jgi:hypothetical protein
VKANRLVLLAAAGASVLTLSGCSTAGGDVAATVDGKDITNSDVTFLAREQCDALNLAVKDPAQSSGVQAASRKQVRASMLNALVQAQLNRELGDSQKVTYDRATYRQAMDQFEQTVQQTPQKDRSRFRDLVGGLYQGQLQVYAIATRDLAAQGVEKPTQDQVETAVTKLQNDFRATAEVKIDPVYGAGKSGVAGAEDTSLSAPVSAFARGSVGNPENPTWVGALPANQKCG